MVDRKKNLPVLQRCHLYVFSECCLLEFLAKPSPIKTSYQWFVGCFSLCFFSVSLALNVPGYLRTDQNFKILHQFRIRTSQVLYHKYTVVSQFSRQESVASTPLSTSHNKLRACVKFRCTFSKYHRAVTAKQRKLQTHG